MYPTMHRYLKLMSIKFTILEYTSKELSEYNTEIQLLEQLVDLSQNLLWGKFLMKYHEKLLSRKEVAMTG
jgi:hypothetical protein